MTIPAYPLQWPNGWRRTDPGNRKRARFGRASSRNYNGSWTASRPLTINEAVERLRAQLATMGIQDWNTVISTNLVLRLDGLPRSNQSEPSDPGAAVYWRDSTQAGWPARCMAIDLYDRVADNLAALAATLEAMRAIERHGGAEILHRAFTGFTALPSSQTETWWDALGVARNAHPDAVLDAYKRKRAAAHPDRGGTTDDFLRIQTAWEQFCEDRGTPP